MQSNLYFNSKYLPKPQGEFVAWCDGMGTGRCISRSLPRAANSVFKLHTAFSIVQSRTKNLHCYPIMDGIYVTSPSQQGISAILRNVFCELAKEFIFIRGTSKMHMMRAGLAFGPILHGEDIPDEAFCGTFKNGRKATRKKFEKSILKRVRSQVFLSPAMVLAYNAEKLAPPFGIYVDDSAKSYPSLSPRAHGNFISNIFQWWILDREAREIAAVLYDQIKFYLSKSETHSIGMGYPIESIRKHRALAEEYFGGLEKDTEKLTVPAMREEVQDNEDVI